MASCEEAREDAREDEDVNLVELAKELLHGCDSSEATLRLPQDAREGCKGTVVGYDAEKCRFTMRVGEREQVGCRFVQVERARLHFDHKAVMGRVQAFNDSAGVLGRCLSECGRDAFAGALQIATCQEGLDELTVFLQLTLLLRMMTEEGGQVLELHMTDARRLLDLKVTVGYAGTSCTHAHRGTFACGVDWPLRPVAESASLESQPVELRCRWVHGTSLRSGLAAIASVSSALGCSRRPQRAAR